MRHSLGMASIRGLLLFHFPLLKCGVYWRAGFKRGNTVFSKHFLEISSVGLPFTIVPIKMADALSMIRELKQTNAAAERRRSTSKFLFRRTRGQVNSLGP